VARGGAADAPSASFGDVTDLFVAMSSAAVGDVWAIDKTIFSLV
jgi:hypothetical protein